MVTIFLIGCSMVLHAQLIDDSRIVDDAVSADHERDVWNSLRTDVISAEELIAATPAAIPQIPDELHDAAFDRHVDLLLLGRAWEACDAALMADVAMQLAEGERVLLRSHNTIKAAEVFQLAAKIATDRRDQATLDRLRKHYEKAGDQAAAESLAAARKLAAETRDVDPALLVPIDEVTPEGYALYRGLLAEIKAARYIGNRDALEALDGEINDLHGLSDQQKEYLRSVLGTIRAELEGVEAPELANHLDKLQSATRSVWWWLVEWWDNRAGIWYIDMSVELWHSQIAGREAERARARERQLQNCGYRTRTTTATTNPVTLPKSTARWKRAPCPTSGQASTDWRRQQNWTSSAERPEHSLLLRRSLQGSSRRGLEDGDPSGFPADLDRLTSASRGLGTLDVTDLRYPPRPPIIPRNKIFSETKRLSLRRTHHDLTQITSGNQRQDFRVPAGHILIESSYRETNRRQCIGPRIHALRDSNGNKVGVYAVASLSSGPKYDRWEGVVEGEITLKYARPGAEIDQAARVYYDGKYLGQATLTTYQGRKCWMFNGGSAAIYRFTDESQTRQTSLLSLR